MPRPVPGEKMSNYVKHSFHLVDESPWPLVRAVSAFYLTTGLVAWFYGSSSGLAGLGGALVVLAICQ